jgi:hypothetical protein
VWISLKSKVALKVTPFAMENSRDISRKMHYFIYFTYPLSMSARPENELYLKRKRIGNG